MPDAQQPAGHVVVCGIEGVGLRTVEQLHAAGVAVVVVPDGSRPSPVAEKLLDGWGVRWVTGRSREALTEAGIARAAAVVCVPTEDVRAMELALVARRLRPDVRIVVRMGNAAVGRALAEVTGEGSVLDVAALAAPSVVEACLGARPHQVLLGGERFVAADLIVPRDGTLRELYGALAPISVAARDDAPQVICPGRDQRVREGDRVTAIGTPAQFEEPGLDLVNPTVRERAERHTAGARASGAARAAARESTGGRPPLRALLRSLVAEADRPLRTTLLLLAALFVLSVVVLRINYVKPDGTLMTILDAVYFTVETIGTIGYGDFSFADQNPWLRAWAIVLMLLGAVLAAILFALITQLLVSRRLERSFGRRRVGSMKGHVLVVGLGAVGLRVVEGLLRAGARVVVVERDDDNRYLARARELGVPVVVGDGTDPALLNAVNLASASAVAVLTSNDLVNVETGLAVRGQLGRYWSQVPVVLRVFDRELGDVVGDGFDFRWVRSTAALAAPWFVGAALGLGVLGTFYVDRTPFLIGTLRVSAGSGLDGLAMGELSARTRVVAIHRAADGSGERALEFPPRSGTRFGAGDDAFLVGPYEELLAVLRRDALAPGLLDRPPGHGTPGHGPAESAERGGRREG
ncbi:MAG TPA: NAD-binding protein [Pseudonocardia sp.]